MDNDPKEFDVMVIGGGPGGLSAAFWCAELGLKAVLFDKDPEFGGQLLWTFNSITNYLGVKSISGQALRDDFLRTIANTDVTRVAGAAVANADLATKTVHLDDGKRFPRRQLSSQPASAGGN